MMWWYGNDVNGWGYALMTISMILFWGLVIFGVVGFVRYLGRQDQPERGRPTAEQLLAERFARGEIDDEEFHRRLDALHRGSRPHITH